MLARVMQSFPAWHEQAGAPSAHPLLARSQPIWHLRGSSRTREAGSWSLSTLAAGPELLRSPAPSSGCLEVALGMSLPRLDHDVPLPNLSKSYRRHLQSNWQTCDANTHAKKNFSTSYDRLRYLSYHNPAFVSQLQKQVKRRGFFR